MTTSSHALEMRRSEVAVATRVPGPVARYSRGVAGDPAGRIAVAIRDRPPRLDVHVEPLTHSTHHACLQPARGSGGAEDPAARRAVKLQVESVCPSTICTGESPGGSAPPACASGPARWRVSRARTERAARHARTESAMATDLTTINVLLGIMAAVSRREALAVLSLFAAGALLYRRVLR